MARAPIDKSRLPARLQPRSEVFSNNVDSRLLSEPIEIRAEPGVGSLASHLHQVGQIVPICIELVEGVQLSHHVGGLDAVYQAFASSSCR